MRFKISDSVPQELHEIIHAAVCFYIGNFMGKEAGERLEFLRIDFNPMKDKADRMTVAQVSPLDVADDDYKTRPTKYRIEYNTRFEDMKIGHFLRTLFHELTHIRQFSSGDLRYSSRGGWVWKGKKYNEETNYWLHPWEHEAQGLEVSVIQLFAMTHPHFNLTRKRTEPYNGRKKSGWKPLPKQPLTNPVKSTT